MLDEAHERTIHTDVLFGLLKGTLTRRPGTSTMLTPSWQHSYTILTLFLHHYHTILTPCLPYSQI
jgi:ATP-dependent RNA helicase DHX8/PRP22